MGPVVAVVLAGAVKMHMKTLDKGNAAIETHVWTLSIGEGRVLRAHLRQTGRAGKGSYWYEHAIRPVNRAVYHRRTDLTIVTAGFPSSEFTQIARDCGISIEHGGFQNETVE